MSVLSVLFTVREKKSRKTILAVPWLEAGRSLGDVGLAVNSDCFAEGDLKKICSSVLEELLRLMGLGVRMKVEQMGETMGALTLIGNSPHYPFAFVPILVVEEIEEHTSSEVVASIHRLAKRPLSQLPADTLCSSCAPSLEVGDDEHEQQLAATTLASLLTAKTRRGYYLSLVLAQSLPLFTRAGVSAEAVSTALAAALNYVYGYYGRRIAGEFGETMRFLMAEPPTPIELNPSELYASILDTFKRLGASDTQLLIAELESTVKARLGLQRSEILFGRSTLLHRALTKTITGGKYDTIVTVATEQWGPLQRELLAEHLDKEGTLAVLFTQASLHNVLAERIVSGWLKTHGKLVYVPTSATDSYLLSQESLEAALKKHVKNKRTIVVAQGPASIALPLYAWAKKTGAEAVLV
ncbi:hypothetical protein [Infirmifilum sp. NZ]|uniref:hypothetical protein n=1 Tax=Infirmifilum sp. NZ TaxID=2926850 RepID=UPI0027AA31DE|nr:hypothetical protein [Infirmifilum sp. NZ]UNQ73765.1 hypothetical protein MOV14_01820 [Infirmifilum sp. NZ]